MPRRFPLSALVVLTLTGSVWAAPPPPELSAADAVRLGLEHNLDLRSKRFDRDRSAALALAAWQPYSPVLFASSTGSRTPPGTVGIEERRFDSAVGAAWRSPYGTQLSGQAELDQALPGSGDPVNNASVSLVVAQPLLKDAWAAGASLPLIEARFNASIQAEIFKDQVNAAIVALETAYWDLALAQSDVEVKIRSRQRAQSQYEDTKENIRRGIIAESEIYVVEENVVIFDQDLLRAHEDLANARRRLGELLVARPEDPIKATDALVVPKDRLPQRDAAVQQALATHPKVVERRFRLDLATARRAYWANQVLPSLGVNAAVALRGFDTALGSAWSEVFARPQPEGRLGLTFSMPLDRAAVNASYERAQIDVDQAQAELLRVEQAARFEVETAWNDLDTTLRSHVLATRQVELAELKLKAQVEKYQSGLSTLADVVRFQRDLDSALSAAQRVVRSARVGQARLLSAMGTLADARQGTKP